jgi:hypothetical protein
MNYEILIDFIEDFLPDPQTNNETFYVALFARKKYVSEKFSLGNGDRNQLKRFIATKKNLLRKIEQLELPITAYTAKDGTTPIPENALALYILPNPRDLRKATFRLINSCLKSIETESEYFNLVNRTISEIHKSPVSKKPFIIFDIDRKEESDLEYVSSITNGFHHVLETKNGFHIIIQTKNIGEFSDNLWYKKIAGLSDQVGDIMIPIPGCRQGDFSPYFLNEGFDPYFLNRGTM